MAEQAPEGVPDSHWALLDDLEPVGQGVAVGRGASIRGPDPVILTSEVALADRSNWTLRVSFYCSPALPCKVRDSPRSEPFCSFAMLMG